MIVFITVLSINIQVINQYGLRVLRQLDIIHVGTFLVNIMNHDQVIYDLHLMQDITSRNLNAVLVFELNIRVQLMDKYLASMRAKMEHYAFVVEACNEELVLHPFLI